jgi:glyoxylase-like metal-dependent hydrolase (beta-lactamase superfamily II)
MASPNFRTDFNPIHGAAVVIAQGVRRITAPNEGPFTFRGTNSYLVGEERLAVVDPGPNDSRHLEAILRAAAKKPISHIFVTHTHTDHSPGAAALAARTGAITLAQGPHRSARSLHFGEENTLDASADRAFAPEISLRHGDVIESEDWQIEAVLTPGHTSNHCAFALRGRNVLFSGDHVMAWSTSIVAPPDGSMSDYMKSLDLLLERRENLYFPGHGGPLQNARQFTRALCTHRKMREAAILARLRAGDRSIAQIVAAIYHDTDSRLHGAAALTVFAHIEDMVARGKVVSTEPPSLASSYEPAG